MEKTLNYATLRTAAKTLILSAAALAFATPVLAQTTISQNGDLGPGDETLNDGEYYEMFRFEGRAGDPIDVTMTSSQFDTFLILTGPNEFGVGNDDEEGGSTTNSRITATLPSDGAYALALTSLSGGETGGYQLRGSYGRSNGGSARPAANGGSSGTNLDLGRPVSGRLSSGDEQLGEGEYFDNYNVRGAGGTRVVIKLDSNDFDAYLVAVDGSGDSEYAVENDDDPNGNGTTNSLLEATIPASGLLVIAATSLEGEQTGSYSLVVESAGGAGSGGFRKK